MLKDSIKNLKKKNLVISEFKKQLTQNLKPQYEI